MRRKKTTNLLLLCTVSLIFSLFSIKYKSRDKVKELKGLEVAIKSEERKIQLLEADFAHRTRPQAIRKMIFLLPNLKPINPSQREVRPLNK